MSLIRGCAGDAECPRPYRAFPSSRFGDITAIEDVTMSVQPGEIHGLVGESGAGKSTVGAIIGLLQAPGYVAEGSMSLGDTDLRRLSPVEAHHLRGKRISMILQDPQTSLNPLMRVEDQLIETMQAHEDISTKEARARAVEILEEIGIQNASGRYATFPASILGRHASACGHCACALHQSGSDHCRRAHHRAGCGGAKSGSGPDQGLGAKPQNRVHFDHA